jgi:hypothetical protein
MWIITAAAKVLAAVISTERATFALQHKDTNCGTFFFAGKIVVHFDANKKSKRYI